MLVANVIFDVQMSTPSPVKLLRGHTLTLNCTATTALNTRVQMTWSYPGKVSDQFFYFFYKIVFLLSNEMPLCFCSGKIRMFWLLWQCESMKNLWVWFGCFLYLAFHESDIHRYGLLMSGGFILKYIDWYFYCMILGGKRDCFILGNHSLGFRDERNLPLMPGRDYLL